MLTISTSQMRGLAREHAARDREAAWLRDELRASYGHLLETVGDSTMLAELREALARCDALMLTSPEDRRIFCTWDQIVCPGMRTLPQWPQWIAHCRRAMQPGEHSALLRFLSEAPPAWWERQLREHQDARVARNLPDLHKVTGPALGPRLGPT